MRKYLPHILIILFVFLLAPTALVTSYAGEVEDAREEVRNNPDDANAHYNLGIAYYNTGKHKEAIESYKQAIRLDPDFAMAHYNLGTTYNNTGKYQKAIESHKHAIRLDPDDADTHYNLGNAYIILKDRGSALVTCPRCLYHL